MYDDLPKETRKLLRIHATAFAQIKSLERPCDCDRRRIVYGPRSDKGGPHEGYEDYKARETEEEVTRGEEGHRLSSRARQHAARGITQEPKRNHMNEPMLMPRKWENEFADSAEAVCIKLGTDWAWAGLARNVKDEDGLTGCMVFFPGVSVEEL